jgi:PKD domain
MKITKTTLLFIATLFFLALPMAFVGSNAQAAAVVYNADGASHDATTHGWSYPLPSTTGTCVGADSTTPSGTSATTLNIDDIGPRENCSSIAPAWVLALDQTTCGKLGYKWSRGACGNSWTDSTDSTVVAAEGQHVCLYCHNGGHGYNMAGYLKGGHKNMTRKADSIPYTTSIEYGSVDVPGYDWTTAVVGAADGAPASPSSLKGKALYWIYDGWLSASPRAIIDQGLGTACYTDNTEAKTASFTSTACTDVSGYWDSTKKACYTDNTEAKTASFTSTACTDVSGYWDANARLASYSCSRCHTTGWSADTNVNTSKEPEKSFPGINKVVNLSTYDDNGNATASASWDHFGILCSRCHYAVDGHHANTSVAGSAYDTGDPNADDSQHMDTSMPAGGPSQVAKCLNCHRQVDSKNLPDNAQAPNPGEELVISAGHGTPGLESHGTGYLNSPHAMFTGTFGQLADSTQYLSGFVSEEGTCAACHNVHDSLTDTTNPDTHVMWNKECGLDCHSQSGMYSKPLSAINHPTGPGTPFQPGGYGTVSASVTDPVVACETCHMPGGIHLFRISTDVNYTTYPAKPASGTWLIPTVPDPSNNNFPEAYVDLDLACGQCHGGGDASTVTAAKKTAQDHGAPYFTKAELVPYAEVMHGGSGSSAPTGKLFMWTNDSSNPYVVNFTVTGAACTEGGCSYKWNFGDNDTTQPNTGAAVSHDYSTTTAGAPVNVTVTVSNGGTNTQIVTPTAVHTAPTCSATPPANGTVNAPVSFTDNSTADGSAGVYINWGDGSPLSTGTPGGTTGTAFSHTYIWPGKYKVTQIVQDDMGFNCSVPYYVSISKAGVTAGSGTLDINTDATFVVSYYVKGSDGLTKKSGTLATGDNNLTLVPDTYNVYLYFANGNTCTWTQGQSATVTDGTKTTVTATSCGPIVP